MRGYRRRAAASYLVGVAASFLIVVQLGGDLHHSGIQFRAEFFNLFNHPNFDLPEGNLASPDFGRVQSAKDSRQIQFGLRLEF